MTNERERFMRLALIEAQKAFDEGETPVGAVLVKDGEIVFERGWGERELGKAPVDAHTLFAIASNTKAFTAAALSTPAVKAWATAESAVTTASLWWVPWVLMWLIACCASATTATARV